MLMADIFRRPNVYDVCGLKKCQKKMIKFAKTKRNIMNCVQREIYFCSVIVSDAQGYKYSDWFGWQFDCLQVELLTADSVW